MLFAKQLMDRNPLGRVRRYRLNPDQMRQPQQDTEITRLEESGLNIGSALRKLKEGEGKGFANVLLAMKKIVPGLIDIDVRSVGRYLSTVFVQRHASGDAEFTSTEMSEGALRALGIIVAAEQMTREELLIIEEPEVNIHAGAANLLFDVLKAASKRGGVLVTTHSAELLDAARDEEILVCSYAGGVTQVGPPGHRAKEGRQARAVLGG